MVIQLAVSLRLLVSKFLWSSCLIHDRAGSSFEICYCAAPHWFLGTRTLVKPGFPPTFVQLSLESGHGHGEYGSNGCVPISDNCGQSYTAAPKLWAIRRNRVAIVVVDL